MHQDTTRRVLVTATGAFLLEQVPVTPPGPGEALVEMLAAGICGSDTHAAQGRHPFIELPYAPGHEVVGRVVAVGEGQHAPPPRPVEVGQRVVVEPFTPCGRCQYCTDGRYNLCSDLVFFGCGAPTGGLAERFVLPLRQLHPVPDEVGDLTAALVEPLSTPVHAALLAGDLHGRSVAVLGAGTIGLLTAAVARHAGAAHVAVLDRSAERRERALRLGADTVYDSTVEDVVGRVRSDLGGSAAVVFDCIARQDTMDQSVALALNGGTVVVVGVPGDPLTVAMPYVQGGQVRIQGSATYVASDIERAVELLAGGLVDPADYVTARFGLDQAEEAFAEAGSGRHVKVVLVPAGAAAADAIRA